MSLDLADIMLLIAFGTIVLVVAIFAFARWLDGGDVRVTTDWQDDPATFGDHVEVPRR